MKPSPALLLRLVLVAGALLLGVDAGRAQTPAPAAPGSVAKDARVLRIAVMRDGRVTADGAPITMEALGAKLTDLVKDKGIVWYHREAANEEPHPNATAVMNLVIARSLPIRFSTKPDYSDSIR